MRILLIQLKRIGDVILTTPVLAALRDALPDSKLTLAIDANAAGLAEAIPADEVLVRRPRDLGFWRRIVAGQFDIALDLTGNDRSALVTALSRAPRRISYQRFANKPFRRWIYTDFVDSSVRDRHTVDHHTDLLQSLGIDVEYTPSRLDLPASAHSEAEAALARHQVSEPFTVIHPGTARAEKYWPAEHWTRLIPKLTGPVVLTGSNDSAEQSHIAKILSPKIINVAGSLSLLGTAALIQRASLVIAVDSAPVHLADALGTPVIALFGPTNPHHWGPRGVHAKVVTPASDISPRTPRHKMSKISVESVLAAIA